MAASVLYTNFGGMLCHEDRGGVQRTYVHDEMGNTSYLVDSTTVTDSFTYTPYGQVSHTGSNVTPFTFIGALGYFATGWTVLTSYVRARWYSNVSGQWGSVDPLWPWQKAYQYVDGNPAMWADPTGLGNPFVDIGIQCGLAIAGLIGNSIATGKALNNWNTLCKSGLGCLLAIIVAVFMLSNPGPVGGCLAGALGMIGAKAIQMGCDSSFPKPGCKDPFLRDPKCIMFELFGDALLGCVLGMISGAITGDKPGAVVDPVSTWINNGLSLLMGLFGLGSICGKGG